MSTDFIALFDIASDDIMPEWLLARLSAHTSFAAELVERYRDQWQTQAWTIEISPATGEPTILGPGGFAFRFESRTLDLYHMMPFWRFTGDRGRGTDVGHREEAHDRRLFWRLGQRPRASGRASHPSGYRGQLGTQE
jgi:hypothetical protein